MSVQCMHKHCREFHLWPNMLMGTPSSTTLALLQIGMKNIYIHVGTLAVSTIRVWSLVIG